MYTFIYLTEMLINLIVLYQNTFCDKDLVMAMSEFAILLEHA